MKRILVFLFLLLATPLYAAGPVSFGGSVATDTIFDAAGDLVYGTGSNTAGRLAAGTAYQVLMTNSGATAPAWTSTLGVTGTRLTKGWFTDLEITNYPSVGGTAMTALSTTTPGTGIITALALNVGEAGAPVVFNGALGTPSSGTGTNLTGLPKLSSTAYSATTSAELAGVLSDEIGAGYSVLSSAKGIYSPTITESGSGDTTPDVLSISNSKVNNVLRSNNNGLITDFDDGTNHTNLVNGRSEFWFLIDDAGTSIDFSSNANIEGNAGVDYTGSATQITMLHFLFVDNRWQEVGLGIGMSDPTTYAPSSLNMGGVILGDATPDATGEIGYDSGVLKYYNGAARTIVNTDEAQTLTNKTLTTPAVTFDESVEPATDTLTAAQLSRGFINNYGQSGAATLTLPTAVEGLSFVAIVGTKVAEDWAFDGNGAETIYTDISGTLAAGRAGIKCNNQDVGSRMSCATFQTGTGAYSWLCGAISGTWTAVAP